MKDTLEDGPLPWDQRPTETARAYEAFTAYLILGPGRSLAKTVQIHTKTDQKTGENQTAGEKNAPAPYLIGSLKDWSIKHEWVERTAAYDTHLAVQARKAAEAAHAVKITAYRDRAAKISAAMSDIGLGFLVSAGKRLKSLDGEAIPISSLPNFLRAAADITQKSLSVEAEALGIHALEELMDRNEDDGAAAD